MSERSYLVVGAGVIGLASAFALARRGAHVTLVDPAPGRGATWAAAGMLAPSAEVAPGEFENYCEQVEAVRAWRSFARDVRAVSGLDVEVHEVGTLLVGWDHADRGLVGQFRRVCDEFDVPYEERRRSTHADDFDGLSARLDEGLFFPGDAWLDPDQVVTGLRTALEVLGVRVIEDTAAQIDEDAQGVSARVGDTVIRADAGLVATGAVGAPPGAGFPARVRPVRGITARVSGLDRFERPMVRAFVRGRAFYLVGREGGYCVLGASSEERREAAVEIGELARLLRDGTDIFPGLEAAALVETRVGLRPATSDQRAFFETSEGGRWAWSSGHYRHGVTMAPLAAALASEFDQERV